MKKYTGLCFRLLLVLTVTLLCGTYALAEGNDAGADDGSDCGCSESGSSISENESSGWGADYATQTADASESVQQESQAMEDDSNDSVNLIWVNLISIAVVAAIVLMMIRNRKSAKTEQKDYKTQIHKTGGR